MQKRYFYCIGLMSGTSLDGIDIVYVKFDISDGYAFQILIADTKEYSKEWYDKLKNAFFQEHNELTKLSIAYGNLLAQLIIDFIIRNNIKKLDFIASHGHTIFHKPEENYTLQIGDGQAIADRTGLKTICDFRTQDVQLGGQGAPLVPIGDRILFSEYDYCLNLGGFANVSYEKNDERIAFDICPVNIVLNYYARKLNVPYDDKGEIASKGNVIYELLDALNSLEFYRKSPPKSLGFEWIDSKIIPLINTFQVESKDVLRTFVEHIAIQVSNACSEKNKKLLVTGGGTFNDFLMERIQMITQAKVITPEKGIINYKEALVFALLGLLRIQNKTNVLSSVTGAKNDHSSGVIFMPRLS